MIPHGLEPGEIDARVREVTGRGEALYELDEPTLARLAPDLIVTQALCAVCAVSYDDVRAVAERLESRPDVISLDPGTLGEVLDDVVRLAQATGVPDRGEALRSELQARLDRVRDAVAGAPRPRVVALEWLDPPYAGGHWVPEMIELAGGRSVAGEPGRDSRTATWDELRAARPEVVVAMPCGLYVERGRRAGAGAPRAARVGWAPSASTPSMRPRPSPAPAPAWSTAPSCSRICSTRPAGPRPAAWLEGADGAAARGRGFLV